MNWPNITIAYKKTTYYIALAIFAAYGVSQTAVGQALMVQYPRSTGVVALLALLTTLIHKPTPESPVTKP